MSCQDLNLLNWIKMIKYNKYLILIIIMSVFLFAGVPLKKANVGLISKEEKIGVVVSILPLAEFVEQVGKDKVEVTVIVPPGADPHLFELTPVQLKKISQAQLYVEVGSGLNFELTWMDKIKLIYKDMLICNSSIGITLVDKDPHIWLSPRNAKTMVENISKALIKIDPLSQKYFKKNSIEYINKLDILDKEIKARLEGVKNRRFISYHPSWGYFAKGYDLIQIAIEDKGKEPSAASLAHIIDQTRAFNISIILVSPQYNIKSAEVVAKEVGAQIIKADPLSMDYINNLRKLVEEIITVR
ncbi:MAG: zinc ABC transporter substrate-binding protein [Candidatus Atribacteria bacterium]|nr:zinc ABC transporter substrate-binding protein [Candidatus Atribacteria bacterium]